MSQDEIAVMDGSKCIMQLRGVRPFFSDKFDITKHKQYPLLSDYDKKNEFDIEKYVKNRNRLRFKRNDVVDEVCDVGEIAVLFLKEMLSTRSTLMLASIAAHVQVHVLQVLSLRLNHKVFLAHIILNIKKTVASRQSFFMMPGSKA